MTSYKFNLQVAMMLAFALGLTSCLNRDPHLTQDNATFYVDDVTPTIAPYQVNHNDDVSQKFINFKACIKDNAQKSIIMNIPFAIYADSVEIVHMVYFPAPKPPEKQKQPERQDFKTDRDGCITWQEIFEFKPKTSDRQILLTRTFKALGGHQGSVDAQLAYNPFHDDIKYLKLGFKGQAVEKARIVYSAGSKVERLDTLSGGQISTQVDVSGKLISSEKVPIDVASIGLNFLNRDFDRYEINKALDLTIAHDYRLVFKMNAIRTTYDHGVMLEPINAGLFHYHILIMRDGFDSKKVPFDQAHKFVVASNTFDVRAYAGRFEVDIPFQFDDIAALASRLTIILTVESVDEPETFQVSNFEGLMFPTAGTGIIGQTLNLIPLLPPFDGIKLAQEYALIREKRFESRGLSLLAQNSKFIEVNRPSALQARDPIIAYDLTPTFKTKTLPSVKDPIYAQALCDKYFNGIWLPQMANAFQACKNAALNPAAEKMVTGVLREFVERVDDPKPYQGGLPQSEILTMNSGFDFTDSDSKEEGATTKDDGSRYSGLGAEFNLLAAIEKIPIVGTIVKALDIFNFTANTGIKINYNKDWYYSTGLVQNQAKSSHVGSVRGQSINAEGFRFKLKVSTRPCVMIVPSQELVKLMPGLPIPEGRFSCGDQLDVGTRDEVYYFVNELSGIGASPLSDGMSSADNPLRAFIRGPRTYDLFTRIFLQNKVNVNLRKVPVETRLNDLTELMLHQYMTQEFPGMITPEASPPELPQANPPTGGPTAPKAKCVAHIFSPCK